MIAIILGCLKWQCLELAAHRAFGHANDLNEQGSSAGWLFYQYGWVCNVLRDTTERGLYETAD